MGSMEADGCDGPSSSFVFFAAGGSAALHLALGCVAVWPVPMSLDLFNLGVLAVPADCTVIVADCLGGCCL